ncbi:molybdate transport system substrate-binding protein [Apibacter mensalis]|uniref:Molybdate transport system substrate-binding protein n=1 Tax=Apibacter mensalis TaxID=1586267 RepID=A0A0X3ARW5_9FLAO|nr:molybdate ABC transporter substrate-binding protein [Apibacter mensalis]CVK17074.1 molybdate transport system substrate-binding protein [Apibacter mensalis]
MKRKLVFIPILLFLFVIISCTKERKATIAAAANLRYVLEEIKEQYLKDYPGADLQIIYGSSGTLTQQIINGAPFDLFMSADTKFPSKLEDRGMTSASAINYCYGRVAMWSSTLDLSQGLSAILLPEVKKIAIANPDNAPYGLNSINTLKRLNLYDKVSKRIVWGENINQTAQYTFSGNAEIGFIALSLALAPEMKNKGHYYVLPENICPPIAQAAVLINGWEKNGEASRFLDYIISSQCDHIWKKYGYGLAKKD